MRFNRGQKRRYSRFRVRDQLWKSVNAERTRIASKVSEEQIEIVYADLLSRFPAARAKFVDAFTKLGNIEDDITIRFLAETEQDILKFEGKQKQYHTAMLGNALRATAAEHQSELRAKTNAVIEPVREYLFGVIGRTDREILGASRRSL
jgi:hypothetical protein